MSDQNYNSTIIKLAQIKLEELGFPIQEINGKIDEATEQAIKNYLHLMSTFSALKNLEKQNLRWMNIAFHELRTSEISVDIGNSRSALFEESLTDSIKLLKSSCTCLSSAFVNWCMTHSDIKGTDSSDPQSWSSWGEQLKNPQYGCITIFKPNKSHYLGIVGFYLDGTEDVVRILGTHCERLVSKKNYMKESVLDFRWPK